MIANTIAIRALNSRLGSVLCFLAIVAVNAIYCGSTKGIPIQQRINYYPVLAVVQYSIFLQ